MIVTCVEIKTNSKLNKGHSSVKIIFSVNCLFWNNSVLNNLQVFQVCLLNVYIFDSFWEINTNKTADADDLAMTSIFSYVPN